MTMLSPPVTLAASASLREKLDELRTQLVDLAFTLECRGQIEAADVAITTSARVGELCEELSLRDLYSDRPAGTHYAANARRTEPR
jgi:hypothetical protein